MVASGHTQGHQGFQCGGKLENHWSRDMPSDTLQVNKCTRNTVVRTGHHWHWVQVTLGSWARERALPGGVTFLRSGGPRVGTLGCGGSWLPVGRCPSPGTSPTLLSASESVECIPEKSPQRAVDCAARPGQGRGSVLSWGVRGGPCKKSKGERPERGLWVLRGSCWP